MSQARAYKVDMEEILLYRTMNICTFVFFPVMVISPMNSQTSLILPEEGEVLSLGSELRPEMKSWLYSRPTRKVPSLGHGGTSCGHDEYPSRTRNSKMFMSECN